jgi:hypothetical protein
MKHIVMARFFLRGFGAIGNGPLPSNAPPLRLDLAAPRGVINAAPTQQTAPLQTRALGMSQSP